MDPWTEAIDRILQEAPTRARPLSHVLRELAKRGMSVAGRREWVLRRVSELPETFLVIPGHRIPWAPWPGSRGDHLIAAELLRRETDPWIVSRTRGGPTLAPGGRTVHRLGEGIQALGAGVDPGSQGSVGRWIRATREAHRACLTFTGGKVSRA